MATAGVMKTLGQIDAIRAAIMDAGGVKNGVTGRDVSILQDSYQGKGWTQKEADAALKAVKALPREAKYDQFVTYDGANVRRVWVPLLDAAYATWAAVQSRPEMQEAVKTQKFTATQNAFLDAANALSDAVQGGAFEQDPFADAPAGLFDYVAGDPNATAQTKALAAVLGTTTKKVWQALLSSYVTLLRSGKSLAANDVAKAVTGKTLPKVTKAATKDASSGAKSKKSNTKPTLGPDLTGSTLDTGMVGIVAAGLIGVGLIYWLTQNRSEKVA